MTGCIIPLSSNDTVRDTYEYKYTCYDYISINTMKMFVVRRYWNMVSINIYKYIYLLSCTCIYAYYCVYICIVWSRITQWLELERRYFVCTLRRPSVHVGLEAKTKVSRPFFNGLLTDDCWKKAGGRFEGFVVSVVCLAAVC